MKLMIFIFFAILSGYCGINGEPNSFDSSIDSLMKIEEEKRLSEPVGLRKAGDSSVLKIEQIDFDKINYQLKKERDESSRIRRPMIASGFFLFFSAALQAAAYTVAQNSSGSSDAQDLINYLTLGSFSSTAMSGAILMVSF